MNPVKARGGSVELPLGSFSCLKGLEPVQQRVATVPEACRVR
jgi:hypothetical protein